MFHTLNNTLIKPKPFTKWTGGKRQLLSTIQFYAPQEFNHYYEPFVGGGAVLFELAPGKAVINDLNKEMANVYRVIKDNVPELIELLEYHQDHNTKEYFYELRAADRDGRITKMSDVEKAARILYMLRVDFNGLYRVNRHGQFNAPYGRYKTPKIVDRENLWAVSEFLNTSQIEILDGDFSQALNTVQPGDFIFLDPPYIPISDTAAFTSYTADGFSLEDQKRLRDEFIRLDGLGAKVLLCNSNSSLVHVLYEKYEDKIKIVQANRMINSKATSRGKVEEVMITNY